MNDRPGSGRLAADSPRSTQPRHDADKPHTGETPGVRQLAQRPLVAAQHPDDDALNRDVVLVDVDRRHGLIRRLQPNAPVALAIELLDGRRGCAEHGDDHFAVVGTLPLVDDNEIAVTDLLVDHRVSTNAKHIVLPVAPHEVLGHRYVLIHGDGLDRYASRDLTEERELDRAGERLRWQNLDRPALVVIALDVAFALQITQVLVHR